MKRLPEILGIIALVAMAVACVPGCKSAKVAGIDEASRGTARISQRFAGIEDAAAQALPDAGVVKPLVAYIGQQAMAGRVDVKAVDASLADAQREVNALQAKYDKLNGNRWVQVALWLQRAFWAAVIGLIAINIFVAASPFLGGWAVKLGKNFVRLASLVGPGAYTREAALKLKGAS